MATTLQQIAQYLDRRGWRYETDTEHSRMITGVRAEHVDRFLIAITLHEGGEYIILEAPQLLMVREHVYKGVLFQTMLTIAWEMKLLCWQYDPSDGEVRASIGFALEDAALTERQFTRALEALIHTVDQVAMPRLKAVLATGQDPGGLDMSELAEQVQQLVAQLQAQLPNADME